MSACFFSPSPSIEMIVDSPAVLNTLPNARASIAIDSAWSSLPYMTAGRRPLRRKASGFSAFSRFATSSVSMTYDHTDFLHLCNNRRRRVVFCPALETLIEPSRKGRLPSDGTLHILAEGTAVLVAAHPKSRAAGLTGPLKKPDDIETVAERTSLLRAAVHIPRIWHANIVPRRKWL